MNCQHCSIAVTPDNDIEVSDGTHYHVLCYRDACLASGLPDPYPTCDGCDQIIWQTDAAGELKIVEHGQKCDHDSETGQNSWRTARWHPECAPSVRDLGEKTTKAVVREMVAKTDAAIMALAEPELTLEERIAKENAYYDRQLAPATGPTASGSTASDGPPPPLPEPIPDPTQLYEDGYPVCPTCEKTVKRSPTKVFGQLHHKTCAAKVKCRLDPNARRAASRSTRPKCPVCTKGVPDDDKRVSCEVQDDDGTNRDEHYHRACYRRVCIEAGQPDPFPPPHGEEIVERFKAGKEKKARAKKEATVVCGICDQKILRSAYRDHILPCAQNARDVWEVEEAERLAAEAAAAQPVTEPANG